MRKIFVVLSLLILGVTFLATTSVFAQSDRHRHHHDPPSHLFVSGNGNKSGEVIENGDGTSQFVLSGRQLSALRWYIIHSNVSPECEVTSLFELDPPFDDIPVHTNADGRFDELIQLKACPQNNYAIWVEGPWSCIHTCVVVPDDFVYSGSTTTYNTVLDLDSPQR